MFNKKNILILVLIFIFLIFLSFFTFLLFKQMTDTKSNKINEYLRQKSVAEDKIHKLEYQIENFELKQIPDQYELTNIYLINGYIDNVDHLIDQKIESFEQQINSISQQINSISQQINSISQQINSISEKITSISQQINSISEKITSISQQINSISEKITSISQNNSHNIQTLEQKKSQLINQNTRLKTDKNKLEREKQDLESKISEFQSRQNELDRKKQDLESKIEEFKNIKNELSLNKLRVPKEQLSESDPFIKSMTDINFLRKLPETEESKIDQLTSLTQQLLANKTHFSNDYFQKTQKLQSLIKPLYELITTKKDLKEKIKQPIAQKANYEKIIFFQQLQNQFRNSLTEITRKKQNEGLVIFQEQEQYILQQIIIGINFILQEFEEFQQKNEPTKDPFLQHIYKDNVDRLNQLSEQKIPLIKGPPLHKEFLKSLYELGNQYLTSKNIFQDKTSWLYGDEKKDSK